MATWHYFHVHLPACVVGMICWGNGIAVRQEKLKCVTLWHRAAKARIRRLPDQISKAAVVALTHSAAIKIGKRTR